MQTPHARTLPLAMASPFATGRIIGGLLAGLAVITVLMLVLISRSGVSGDCGWSAPVAAWVDADRDGQRDAGEPPLEGVRITVNDTVNGYPDVGGRRYTNWEGNALAQVWLPGCPNARFTVTGDPPGGYAPTTARTVAVDGAGYGDQTPIQFGFARMPGIPAPTPYVAGLTCVAEERAAYDIAAGPDGAVWLASEEAAAVYRPDTELWQTFPLSMTLWGTSVRLQVGADETVWVSDRMRGAARLRQGRWSEYPNSETLIGASEPSIGTSRDGRVWFAPESPPNAIVAYDPARATWQAWFGDRDHRVESVRLFTDGSVWRAGFGFAADYPAPAPTPEGWTVFERHIFADREIRDLTVAQGWGASAALGPGDALWVVSTGGLSRYDLARDTWQTFAPDVAEPLRGAALRDVAVSAGGDIWIAAGSEYPLAFEYTPADGRWRSYDPRDGLPRLHTTETVAVDGASGVWFGFGWNRLVAHCARRA